MPSIQGFPAGFGASGLRLASGRHGTQEANRIQQPLRFGETTGPDMDGMSRIADTIGNIREEQNFQKAYKSFWVALRHLKSQEREGAIQNLNVVEGYFPDEVNLNENTNTNMRVWNYTFYPPSKRPDQVKITVVHYLPGEVQRERRGIAITSPNDSSLIITLRKNPYAKDKVIKFISGLVKQEPVPYEATFTMLPPPQAGTDKGYTVSSYTLIPNGFRPAGSTEIIEDVAQYFIQLTDTLHRQSLETPSTVLFDSSNPLSASDVRDIQRLIETLAIHDSTLPLEHLYPNGEDLGEPIP